MSKYEISGEFADDPDRLLADPFVMTQEVFRVRDLSLAANDRWPATPDDLQKVEKAQFGVIETFVDASTTPVHLENVAAVYAAVREQFVDAHTAAVGPQTIVGRLVSRATDIHEDPKSGMAPPTDIAAFVQPSVVHLLSSQWLRNYYDDSSSGWNHTLESQVTRGLARPIQGTAERVAGVRLVDALVEEGNQNLYGSMLAKPSYRTGQHYITQHALRYIYDRGIAKRKSLPENYEALETMVEIIHTTIAEAAQKNYVAVQLQEGYRKLRQPDRHSGTQGVMPVTTTLALADAITPQLQERLDTQTSQIEGEPVRLERFKKNDIAKLPQAFDRLLFAIDPKLLEQATNTDLYDGSELRLRHVYLEALAQQWTDSSHTPGRTVGDYILRLVAQGNDPAEIAAKVEEVTSAHPDDFATRRFRRVQRNPETNATHVTYKRRKPGHGVIS